MQKDYTRSGKQFAHANAVYDCCRPWDTLACSWDVTNNNITTAAQWLQKTHKSLHPLICYLHGLYQKKKEMQMMWSSCLLLWLHVVMTLTHHQKHWHFTCQRLNMQTLRLHCTVVSQIVSGWICWDNLKVLSHCDRRCWSHMLSHLPFTETRQTSLNSDSTTLGIRQSRHYSTSFNVPDTTWSWIWSQGLPYSMWMPYH